MALRSSRPDDPAVAWRAAVEARYPELVGLELAELARVRATLPVRDAAGSFEAVGPNLDMDLFGCDPRVVLGVLLERSSEPGSTRSWVGCVHDAIRNPGATWLARHADHGLDDVLLRLLRDRSIEFDLRDAALVALCRPGNAGVMEALTAYALDPDVDPLLRERTIVRIERIGAMPPEPFRDLLALPFHGLDAFAAATLALGGDPAAPSLVVEGLRGCAPQHPGDREHHLARAAAAIAWEDPDVVERADEAVRAAQGSLRWTGDPPVADTEAAADALDRWLAAHPEARDTPFERARRAYRESPRHRKERRTLEVEEPWTLAAEELDLGAAAMRIATDDEAWRLRWLDGLDRLGRLLALDLAGVEDPLDRLAVLHRRLLSRTAPNRGRGEEGPPSFLNEVLRDQVGNCVGLTSLYVVLGERLGLPLSAVQVPGHVFLRWDDGTRRFDVELTDGGRLRTGADPAGEVPRALTARGLLSVVLANESTMWLESPWIRADDRVSQAVACADRALAWDETNDVAWLVRARAVARLGDPEGAVRAAQRAFALRPGSAAAPVVAGEALLLASRPADALAWFDRARGLDPDDAAAVRGRLVALARLERPADVVADAEAFLGGHEDRAVRLLRLRALVDLGRAGWSAELERLANEGTVGWGLRLDVAERLLRRGEAAAALDVLDGLRDLDRAVAAARGDGEELELVGLPGDRTLFLSGASLHAYHGRAQALREQARDLLRRDGRRADR